MQLLKQLQSAWEQQHQTSLLLVYMTQTSIAATVETVLHAIAELLQEYLPSVSNSGHNSCLVSADTYWMGGQMTMQE